MSRRLVTGAVLAALLTTTAACGSTVQTDQQSAGAVAANGQLTPVDSLNGAVPPGGVVPGVDPATGGTGGTGTTGTGGTTPGGTTGGVGSGGGTNGGSGTGNDPGNGGGGGTTPETGAPPSGGPTIGASDPVDIGFLITATSNAASLGIGTGSTYADQDMFKALVTEYNAAGGLAGHPIKPVYAKTDTGGSNWSNEFAAACSTFTEDNKVSAVIGYQFAYVDAFEACLAKAGAAHFYGGFQPGDTQVQQQYPTLLSTGNPTVEGANLAVLTGALRSGLIGGDKKVGLLLDTCAHGDRAFKNSTEPWLKANKISYEAIIGNCANGSGDAGAAAAAVSNAELRFVSQGVDTVYAVGIPLLLFMTQAMTQGYSPTYITSIASNAIASLAPRAQAMKLHGFGWMPVTDVALTKQPYGQTAAQKACVAKLAKHGLRPSGYNDYMTAYQACDGLELYAKALAATRSDDPRTIVDAAVKALPKFQGAGTYNGALRASAGQRGGPAVYRESTYQTSCSCLVYRGSTYPVPAS